MTVNPPAGWASRLAAIADDELRGAAELADEGARLVADYVRAASDHGNDERTVESLRSLVVGLTLAKPAMAPLINLANQVDAAFEQQLAKGTPSMALTAAGEVARTWLKQSDWDRDKLLEVAMSHLPPTGGTVVCYSRSSTLAALFEWVSQAPEPRIWRIVLSEARPGCEGLTLAREAVANGHQVTLATDGTLPGLLRRLEPDNTVVVVGADTITADHLVNKVGTYPLLLAARQNGIPTYVVATSAKFLSLDFTDMYQPGGRDCALPGEWLDLEGQVELERELFEMIPLDLVTGIITEKGLVPPDEISIVKDSQPGE